MDIDRARYFLAVCETGSVRKGSEIAHISAAAMSKAVKILERELGLQLLKPAGRAIEVTDAGRRFARRIRPILDELDAIQRDTKSYETREAVKIGTFEVFGTYFAQVLARETQAGGSLTLSDFGPGRLEKALLAEEVDLGLTYLPIPTRGLEFLKIATIEMGAFARGDRFRSLPFEQIPFAAPAEPVEGAPSRVRGLDGWPDDRLKRYIRYRVSWMEAAMELCRSGLAAAYLPAFVVRLHNEKVLPEFRLARLRAPKVVERSPQGVYLIQRKSEAPRSAVKRVVELVRAHCR